MPGVDIKLRMRACYLGRYIADAIIYLNKKKSRIILFLYIGSIIKYLLSGKVMK